MFLSFLVSAALGAGVWFLYPPASPAPFLLFLFVLSFFRDFERPVPADPDALVSPADGRVTEITECEEPLYIQGPAVRIGIFLSVFNCHINRTPWESEVEYVRFTPGLFLDARHPDSGPKNQSNALGLKCPATGAKLLVRQVTGLIARRIICTAKPGDRLKRGERFGMIKFGSRTELYVPKDRLKSVDVRVGQAVYGASTIIGRLR
ncbi:MAG: phosphatidylserine decarboxylase family protein [Candidatus Brocadiae bacterium]|nr:phosphatidylserine decarboxylase family protein [Candidatus Brocadiia bacterium]